MTIRPVDATDQQILALLSADARASASAIARRVGLSRGAVHQRIARLERDGVIGGYTVLTRRSGGPPVVTAIVMVNLDAPKYAAVAQVIQGWPEVRACWSMAGDRDMALLVDVASNDELMEITQRLSLMRAVRDTATHVALRAHFDRGL